MIISILLYIIFGSILFVLGRKEWSITKSRGVGIKKTDDRWTIYTIIGICFFILISGIRYGVGVDCESYVFNYEWGRMSELRRNEWGYIGLVNILRGIGANRVIYLGALAALQIIPFYYALRRRKYLYPYVGFLLFVGPFYLSWMNGIRQAIAACFFVLASVYIVDNKKKAPSIIAAILIILAAQFHNSAYVLLVFLLIPVWDIFKNKYINIAVLVFCAIVGQLSLVTGYLDGLLGNLNIESDFYSDYTTHLDAFLEDDKSMSYGPRRIIILLLSIELLWFAPKMKAFYDDKFFIYSFNLFFINNCIGENLFSNVNLIFRRPFYYTQPFELICFAYLLYYFYKGYERNKGNKENSKTLLYLFTMGISCCYIIMQCLANAGRVGETTLYKIYLGQ